MTVQDMMASLGLRLEDPESREYTGKYKWFALTNAVNLVANALNDHYLTELEAKDASETVTSNAVAFSGLSHKVLRGTEGIVTVKNTNGRMCTIIPPRQLKRLENPKHAGSRQNPLVWLFGEAIRCLQTLTVIDVSYMRVPSPLMHPFQITYVGAGNYSDTEFAFLVGQGIVETDGYYKGFIYYRGTNSYHVITNYTGATRQVTVAPAAAVNFDDGDTVYFVPTKDYDFHLTNLDAVTCDLDPSLHDLVVTFAEVECFKMARKLDRANAALGKAIDTIKTLNENYEAAVGLGTKGRTRQ